MKWLFALFVENEDKAAPRFKVYWPGVLLGLVFVLAAGSVTAAVVMRRQGRDIFFPTQMRVYFFNPTEGRLYAESRPWPYGNQNDWVAAAIGHLRFPPNSNALVSTWPAINPLLGVEETPFLQNVAMQGNVLVADFYESYAAMPPLQEALFRSALTLTMTNLTFVDYVLIRAAGREWLESAATIANGPPISAARLGNTVLTLYFIDESGDGLVREYYAAVEVDMQQRVREALEKLIDGVVAPEGTFSAIPSDTRILGIVPVIDTASVYVNLSGEFLTRFTGGPLQARLMLAAITNTVIVNSPGATPRQVFFLIDSAREEVVPGFADFSQPFEYDETVMVGFVPDYLYDYDNQP